MVKAVQEAGRGSQKTSKWRELVAAWQKGGWDNALFQSKESLTHGTEAESRSNTMTLTMMLGSLGGDKALLQQGLDNGDIIAVQHPSHPGKTMYKHTVYNDIDSTKTKVSATLKRQGARNADETPALQDAGKGLRFEWQCNAASGSSSASRTAAPSLPLEDASADDKVDLKVEEAVRAGSIALPKAQKLSAGAPRNSALQTTIAEKLDSAIKEVAETVEHLKHWMIHSKLPPALSALQGQQPERAIVRTLLYQCKSQLADMNEASSALQRVVPKKKG